MANFLTKVPTTTISLDSGSIVFIANSDAAYSILAQQRQLPLVTFWGQVIRGAEVVVAYLYLGVEEIQVEMTEESYPLMDPERISEYFGFNRSSK